jgi:hypothetical protein
MAGGIPGRTPKAKANLLTVVFMFLMKMEFTIDAPNEHLLET